MRVRALGSALIAVVGIALAGCGDGGGGGGETGTVRVEATDAPFPADASCVAAVNVTIAKPERTPFPAVAFQKLDGGGFKEVPLVNGQTEVTIDLLHLLNGLTEELAFGELPTGRYHQLRLHVKDAVIEFDDNSTRSFFVPSGAQTGIKINIQPPLLVAKGQEAVLVLDFDLSRSFVVGGAGNSDGVTCDDLKDRNTQVRFTPVIRAVNRATVGLVKGTVFGSFGAPQAGVEATAFAANADPTTAPPVATTFSADGSDPDAPKGSYALLLEPGTYDLYVRAQGVSDRTLAREDVTVATGEEKTVDLHLP